MDIKHHLDTGAAAAEGSDVTGKKTTDNALGQQCDSLGIWVYVWRNGGVGC